MKANKLMLALWFGLLSFTAMAEAGDSQECTTAEEAAQEAYDRTEEAFNSGNKAQTYRYSQSFFEIYEENGSCPFIKLLADQLNNKGITKASVALNEASTRSASDSNLFNSCPAPCRMTINRPGISNHAGMGAREE